MTPCYLCGGREAESVLDKGPVEVWNDLGGPESLRLSHPCVVRQCRNCGHVYQPVDEALRALFDQLYRSRAAQGPSAMGLGAWGRERADALFFREIDVSRHRSAIEIGCGDGYLLRQLKDRGLTALTGIEPSSNTDRADPDGITFINAFVDEHLQMAAPVDLIYSVAVFEHIENINGVLAFCRNNLKPDGELFFVVPNGQRQLERADPALFVHQHVHHFTEHSVRRLLSAHGFSLNTLAHRDDVLCVSASLSGDPTVPSSSLGPRYDQYQPRLDAVLSVMRSIILSAGSEAILTWLTMTRTVRGTSTSDDQFWHQRASTSRPTTPSSSFRWPISRPFGPSMSRWDSRAVLKEFQPYETTDFRQG
jgi:SAM-dependent methyltransferase